MIVSFANSVFVSAGVKIDALGKAVIRRWCNIALAPAGIFFLEPLCRLC